MKTYIVTVAENDLTFISGLFKKLKLRAKALSQEDFEEVGLAEKIIEGMKSEDVSKEKVLKHFRKHGVNF